MRQLSESFDTGTKGTLEDPMASDPRGSIFEEWGKRSNLVKLWKIDFLILFHESNFGRQ